MIPIFPAPFVMFTSPAGSPNPAIAAGETKMGRELGMPRISHDGLTTLVPRSTLGRNQYLLNARALFICAFECMGFKYLSLKKRVSICVTYHTHRQQRNDNMTRRFCSIRLGQVLQTLLQPAPQPVDPATGNTLCQGN